MARYDPYDRGDNPLRFDLDVLDMPKRVADKARPEGGCEGSAPRKRRRNRPHVTPARAIL